MLLNISTNAFRHCYIWFFLEHVVGTFNVDAIIVLGNNQLAVFYTWLIISAWMYLFFQVLWTSLGNLMPLRLTMNFICIDSLETFQPACNLRAPPTPAWPQFNFCVICDIYFCEILIIDDICVKYLRNF